MADEPVTRFDLDKTLEVYAKAIELQILISQQQERLIEKQNAMERQLEKLNDHFSNDFKQDIQDLMTKQVGEVNIAIDKANVLLETINERGWKQTWMWAGITLFTIANAVALIVSLWSSGYVLSTTGK